MRRTHKNLIRQLFRFTETHPVKVFVCTPEMKKIEENITMIDNIAKRNMFSHLQENNRGLMNVFTGVVATPEQHHDMMNFREIGLEYFKHYVNYHLIKSPSAKSPIRQLTPTVNNESQKTG